MFLIKFMKGLSSAFLKLLFFLLFFSSCGPNSIEDCREEANAVVKEIVKILKTIRTREDLLASEKALKDHFNKLSMIIVAARSLKSDEQFFELSDETIPSSQELKKELERIYAFDGGTQIIEKYQETALLMLE